MVQVRTAKGRLVDMQALAKKHEEMRAVSNTNMNARGDRLDASGNVIATIQQVARTQAEVASAPEYKNMSEAPGNKDKKTEKQKTPKANAKTDDQLDEPVVVSEKTKTRKDGSKYLETEYSDGNIDTKELK